MTIQPIWLTIIVAIIAVLLLVLIVGLALWLRKARRELVAAQTQSPYRERLLHTPSIATANELMPASVGIKNSSPIFFRLCALAISLLSSCPMT